MESDAAGAFEIALDRSAALGRLHISARGFASESLALGRSAQEDQPLEVRLELERRLAVRFVRRGGALLGEHRVSVLQLGDGEAWRSFELGTLLRSDWIAVHGLGSGPVRVELEEARISHEFELPAGQAEVELEVPEPGVLGVSLAQVAGLEDSAFRYSLSATSGVDFESWGEVQPGDIERGELELACPAGSMQVWVFSADVVYSGKAQVEWGQVARVRLEQVEDPR